MEEIALFSFSASNFPGHGALSEVNLAAWDTGFCFRNKIVLHHRALFNTVMFKSVGKKGQSLCDTDFYSKFFN